MEIKPEVYEQLGSFYLGRGYDVASKQMDDDLVLYDSKDLVTHGVVLGMTGSGKTGLCLAVLEEAAMDGIPVIAIDPKGDISNFLLTFPNLAGDEFQPWVNEEDARKMGQNTEDYAAAQAALWTKGLGDWGQSAARIEQMRSKVDINIFTPGSNAGIPVSIVASLAAPAPEVLEDDEVFNERVETCVSSLLSLAGIEGDPVNSPEHILVSTIFSTCWQKGQDVTLEDLVRMVQQPPFKKVGVVALDEFLNEKKRNEVAMKLNNLIASPSFASWLQGVPLDIAKMLYTPEGKPRVSIFSIAHLSDQQRMFFVSLLLTQMLSWMRAQSGTTSLRAMLYMDEIYGYLPPTANPPSKKPMMILLKQARAFGLGILLATQNPVDLDYKALSNIGTWWLGRLQTERDKMRVLDGLEGAATSQNAKFDRATIEKTLSALGNRIFLMNNVHEDQPAIFQVRWTMSYLRGPISRDQIKTLMDPKRKAMLAEVRKPAKATPASAGDASDDAAPAAQKQAAATEEPVSDEDAGFLPPTKATATGSVIRPALPDSAVEYFMPSEKAGSYQPALLRSATVLYIDDKKKVNGRVNVTVANEIDLDNAKVLWDKFIDVPRDLDLSALEKNPVDGSTLGTLPNALLKGATYDKLKSDKGFAEWISINTDVTIFYSPLLDEYSNIGETQADFRTRASQSARESRDQAVDDLKNKLGKQAKSIMDDVNDAMAKADAQKSQASSAMMSTAVSVGASLLNSFLGRKTALVTATTINSASRAWKERGEASAAESNIEALKQQLKDLDTQLEEGSQKIRDQYDPTNIVLEPTKLSPKKTNITTNAVGVLWVA